MGRRGGQAAFGCYLSLSSCSSNFDVSATSPSGEKLPPLQPPTLPQRQLRQQQEQTRFSIRNNQMKFRDTEPTGNKFEGGEQRILWENTFKKEIENQSTCRPCRYVGTAEFSFFPQMGGAHTRLWTRPASSIA